MELNTEINRVFGEEMAKVFSKSISQEEIMNAAKEAWKQLNYRESSYWNGGVKDSQIDKLIKSVCLDRLKEEVEKITSTDEFKAQMAVLAKQIVDEIIEETHKKTVEEVSSRLAALSTGYGGYGLKSMIEETVVSMMNR
ncbi:MAG: hypothetical protein ACI4E1_07470 [Lachnospira sp.]